ncbi:periplasmic binding protein-like I [Obelidium mucronatum]|nr:periplasmic binding protein-like I [Obelidium mucronatum]
MDVQGSLLPLFLFLAIAQRATAAVNITIGLIQWYCYERYSIITGSLVSNFSLKYDPSIYDLQTYAGAVYLSDVAVSAAVEIVNRDPQILPGIHVNVKRFSDCGSYWPEVESEFEGKTAGFAASVLSSQIISENTDVLGVVGCEYSTTARAPAQQFSIHKIPYASFGSTSPRLSDKINYPYFWRPLTSAGLGNHMFQLLKTWKVKRFAIVFQKDDDMGSQYAKDIVDSLTSQGMKLVQSIGLLSTLSNEGIGYAYSALKRADARYIIISGQTLFTTQIYYSLASMGLIGTNYVYISYSSSTSSRDLIGSIQGVEVYEKFPGMIKFYSPSPNSLESLYRKYYAMVLELMQTSRSEFRFLMKTLFEWFSNQGLGLEADFDSAMMLLMGFDKLLKSNPSYTPDLLASRKLQDHMNYTLFQNLGYNGLTSQPVILNAKGDLNLPYIITYYTGDYSNTTVFGETDMFGTSFLYNNHSLPVFYGGSSIPPPDGPPEYEIVEIVLNHQHPLGRGILALLFSGILICFMANTFLIWFRTKSIIKRSSLIFLVPVTMGAFILCCSIVFFYNTATVFSCSARVWFQLIGYALIVGSVIMKMNMSYQLILSGQKINKGYNPVMTVAIPIVAICLTQVLFLLLWQMFPYPRKTVGECMSIPAPPPPPPPPSSSQNAPTPFNSAYQLNFFVVCVHPPITSLQTLPLLIYNPLLLLFAIGYAIRTRDVESYTGETAFTSIIVSSFSVIAVVIVPVLAVSPAASPTMSLIQVCCIWGLVVVTLGSLYIPKGVELFIAERARRDFLQYGGSSSKVIRNSVLSQEGSGIGGSDGDQSGAGVGRGRESSVLSGHKIRPISIVASVITKNEGRVEAKRMKKLKWGKGYKERLPVKSKSVGAYPCCIKSTNSILYTPWFPAEFVLVHIRERTWILVNSVCQSIAFSSEKAKVTEAGDTLRLDFPTKHGYNAATIKVQFGNGAEMAKFRDYFLAPTIV